MNLRSALAALSLTLALAGCDQLPFQQSPEAVAPQIPAHSGPPTVSPLDQPIETGAEAVPVATAEARTMNTALFRAEGQGWRVTAGDRSAVYERAGAKSVGVSVRRLTYGRGVEFVGTMNGQVFSLNIQSAECEAGGQRTPFTARLRVGTQRLTGCAAPTDSMPKAQVKASSAAPKPKAPKPAPAKPAPAKPAAPTDAPTADPTDAAPAAGSAGEAAAADRAAPAAGTGQTTTPTTGPETATPPAAGDAGATPPAPAAEPGAEPVLPPPAPEPTTEPTTEPAPAPAGAPGQ